MRRFHLGAGLTGLVFAAAGVLFLLDAIGEIEVLPEVLLPAMLIGLGIAVVMNSLLDRQREQDDPASG